MLAYVSNTFGAAAASPTFLSPALCACNAAAGSVKLSDLSGTLGSLSLRTVFVTRDRRLPRDMMPVIKAAYDIEMQDVNAWARFCQRKEDDRQERREDSVRPEVPPRPQFVVDDARHLADVHNVVTVGELDAVAWDIVNTYRGPIAPEKLRDFFRKIGRKRGDQAAGLFRLSDATVTKLKKRCLSDGAQAQEAA
jgi:hypothetical protein